MIASLTFTVWSTGNLKCRRTISFLAKAIASSGVIPPNFKPGSVSQAAISEQAAIIINAIFKLGFSSAGDDTNEFYEVTFGQRMLRPLVAVQGEAVVFDQNGLRRQLIMLD